MRIGVTRSTRARRRGWIATGLAMAACLAVALALAACGVTSPARTLGHVIGSAIDDGPANAVAQPRPQVIEPTAGVEPAVVSPAPPAPVGDVNAHAPSLAEVQAELQME